jgi:Tol biopolymer transport system component
VTWCLNSSGKRLAALQMLAIVALVSGPTSSKTAPSPERLFVDQPSSWFEDIGVSAIISPDGRRAIYRPAGGAFRLVDLGADRHDAETSAGSLTTTQVVTFAGSGLARRGVLGTEQGWFLADVNGSLHLTTVPFDARATWSTDGRQIAYYRPAQPTELFVGTVERVSSLALSGRITGLGWAPDGQFVYAMTCDGRGLSTLTRVSVFDAPKPAVVAENLDASPDASPVAISADGKHAYVALASRGIPAQASRHDPHAARWLAIYELDLDRRTRRSVMATEADNFAPAVAGKSLLWTRSLVTDGVVVVPIGGGDARTLVDRAELPSWSPDGRHIAFITGGWRLADWALNLDAGIVDLDGQARAVSKPRAFVAGYHEDFTPFWSPDSRWIAYHSHRSKTPVPFYNAPGSTDDVWLRRPKGGVADEIRLTDIGWETGPADWSPDGRHLVFVSWERGGAEDVGKAWIITIDPSSGHSLGVRRLDLPTAIKNLKWAAWSPTGDAIAFEDEKKPGDNALWVVSPDGRETRKLAEYASRTYGGVTWTPDARELIYAALVDGRMQLASIPSGGGAPRVLTHDGANLLHPRVSPDGRWIAATRMMVSKEIWRLRLNK